MPGPILLAPISGGQGRIRYRPKDVVSESAQIAQSKFREMQRWRRNPRNADLRWTLLVPSVSEPEEGEHSDRSESVTPVLDPSHSDLTTGQTGQSSRLRVDSSEQETPKSPQGPDGKPDPKPDPDEPEEEQEVCCYHCSPVFKDKVTEFFEDPMSSTAAYYTSVVVMVAILLSVIALLLETLPELEHYSCCEDTAFLVFAINEAICITIFTVEYLIRIWAARDRCWFARQPLNVVDLVAILPFYLELMASSLGSISILRMFRLVRVFRVFKLSKHNKAINVCFSALYESRAIFGLMLFMLAILTVVFGSFEYNFEEGGKDPYGEPTPFVSIPASMWWCIVTVMMVGYGDMIPTSIPGKITASACIVVGIMVMALPISVIGTNFSQAWDAQKEEDDKAAKKASQEPIVSSQSLKEVTKRAGALVRKYNDFTRRHIDHCQDKYKSSLIECTSSVWREYKTRIHGLWTKDETVAKPAAVGKKYLALVDEEKQHDADISTVRENCDEALTEQFERVGINIDWIRLCQNRVRLLSEDVKCMNAVLKTSRENWVKRNEQLQQGTQL